MFRQKWLPWHYRVCLLVGLREKHVDRTTSGFWRKWHLICMNVLSSLNVFPLLQSALSVDPAVHPIRTCTCWLCPAKREKLTARVRTLEALALERTYRDDDRMPTKDHCSPAPKPRKPVRPTCWKGGAGEWGVWWPCLHHFPLSIKSGSLYTQGFNVVSQPEVQWPTLTTSKFTFGHILPGVGGELTLLGTFIFFPF